MANNINHDPVFTWWVTFTLREQNIIVSKLQKKYWLTTQKFGNEIPTSVKQAYKIDDKTGTDFWRKSISK